MNHCRLCGGKVKTVLALNPTPIANSFTDEPCDSVFYPLDLRQCEDCQHVQVGCILPDEKLYGPHYAYSTPHEQIPALEKQADALRERYPSVKFAVEIGANNGINVLALRKAGIRTVGFDPSSTAHNVIPRAFDERAPIVNHSIDMIVANNVFAHVTDLDAMFRGIDRTLAEDGVLVFEVQYLLDMAKTGSFDMIYHEHRDYHTLTPLVPFLAKHHLAIKDVEHIPQHGGSIRVHCGRGAGMPIVEATVDWRDFQNKIAQNISHALSEISAARSQIIGLGATAKACTLIHQLGIHNKIVYFVDSTPAKQGKYIPGTGIPILPETTLGQSKSAKTLLLTAWNYEDIFRKRYPDYDFIVPFKQKERMVA